MRKTKIIATLGPASREPAVLERMIDAGMNVARINFSHSTHQEHAALIAQVREAAERKGRPVAILQDLQGPKIRTGPLAGGKAVELRAGRPFIITTDECPGDAERVSTSYAALPDDLRPGDRVLLSDGLMELRVVQVPGMAYPDALQAKVLADHFRVGVERDRAAGDSESHGEIRSA